MFISRKELQELREEISKLSMQVAILKDNTSFWVFDEEPNTRIYSSGHRLSHAEAISLLAKNAGVRFRCQRGPGDHGALVPIETKT